MEEKKGYQILWSITKPIRPYILATILCSAIGALSSIATLLTLSLFVATLIQNEPSIFLGIIWNTQNVLIAISIFGLGTFLFTLLSITIAELGSHTLEDKLRKTIAIHLSKLPLGNIINVGAGDLKKVILEDVDRLHVVLVDTVPTLGRILIAPLSTATLLFIVDWRLALVAFTIMLLGFIVMAFASREMKEMQSQYEESQAKINSSIVEFIQAMSVIRTFDGGSSSFKRYQNALNDYQRVFIEWMKRSSFSSRFAMLLLASLPTILAVLAFGIYFIINGTLTLPSLIAVLFLASGMVDAFMPLMGVSNQIKIAISSATRIQSTLTLPSMVTPEKGKVPESNVLSFENVSFKYDNREDNALSNINFTINEGEKLALVGPSGSGKSTIAKLIPRFWDVSNGSITIGGINLKEMDSETLMDKVSFVFQDVYLFNDTIANNIRMGNSQANMEMVIEAAKAAQIHDFIMSLENGYDTKPGDRGIRLSGGERQRITIARAILRNTPIVVLDEATSFADPENEQAIIQAIASLTEGKTVISIAHRLSTITNVDQIVVLDKGQVLEKGHHNDLISNNGTYSNLWKKYSDIHSLKIRRTV